MMIRPIALGIGLVLSVILWFSARELNRRARMMIIAMLLLGNLIAVVPWEAWVYFKSGQVILLSTNGVKSVRDGLTFAVESKGYRQTNEAPAGVLEVMRDIQVREGEVATFSDLAGVISQEMRSHPIGMTELLLFKLARSWYGTDSGRMELPTVLIQIVYLVFVGWGVRKGWQRGGIQRDFVIGALLIVFYFWGMSFLALSILRYMVPAIGVLIILIAGGLPSKSRTELRPQSL